MASTTFPIKTTKAVLWREIKDYLMIVIGICMYGFGYAGFLLPNHLPSGAVPGIASIVNWGTGVPVEYTYSIINIVLLIAAYFIVGWRFFAKTLFGVFVMGMVLKLVTAYIPPIITGEPFMACVLGASLCGAGIGIAFSHNGSTGGTDIVAAIVNKYRDVSLGRVIMMVDVVIISSSYLVLKKWEPVVYGYVVLIITTYVLDQVVNGARQSVQFFIISKRFEEIGHAINTELHRGVTFIDGVGAYTKQDVKMMFVLAKRRESPTIFRLIKDIDPHAFVSQSAVIGVFGEGFDTIKAKSKKKVEPKIPAVPAHAVEKTSDSVQ